MSLLHHPLAWAILAALLLTAGCVGARGFRGLVISVAIGLLAPALLWAGLVVYLATARAAVPSFPSAGAGLLVAVGFGAVALVLGGLPGILLGASIYALRNRSLKTP
jgi:hypothetical protein